MSQPPYPQGPGHSEGGPYYPPQSYPQSPSHPEYGAGSYGGEPGSQYGGGQGQPYGGASSYGGGPSQPYGSDSGQSYGGGGQSQPYGGAQGQPYGGSYGGGQHQPYGGGQGQPYGGGQQYGVPSQPYGTAQSSHGPSGGPPPEPPKKQSKAGKIVLIVLLVLLVVCGGGGVAAYFALKDDVNAAVDAAKTTVTAPETVAGRKKATDPDLVKDAESTKASLNKDVPGSTGAAAAFYGNSDNLLMVAAVSGRVPDPAKQVDNDIQEAATQGITITNAKPIEPGPLGGVAKCGDAKVEGLPLGVCMWADAGSAGMIVLYGKNATDAGKEFVTIRGAVEQRS